MFSVSLKKKTMLENLKASQAGTEIYISEDKSKEKLPQIESPRQFDIPNKHKPILKNLQSKPSLTADTVESYLWKNDSISMGIQKMAVVASKFNPQRDGVFLNAFKTCSLSYFDFRTMLKRVLFLDFKDDEFGEVCKIFDANGDNFIDGEEFLIGFTLLATAWRDKITRKYREIDRKYLSEMKEKEEREIAIQEAKVEQAAIFEYTAEEKESALSKIKIASRKYMKSHPSAVGLDGFDVKFVKPGEFRELLKRTFNLHTTRTELGALIRHFNADNPDPDNLLVECGSFIIQFMRMGQDQRDEMRLKQLEECRAAELEAQKHHERLLDRLNSKMEIEIDRDYSDEDKARAFSILDFAAVKFQKNHPSSMGLDGFDSKFLSPAAFREMLKRTFNIIVTNKELGALVDYFDFDETDKDMNTLTGTTSISEGTHSSSGGKVDCKKFLLYFAKVGFKGKREKFSNDLDRQRREIVRQHEEHQQKIEKQWEKMSLSAEKLEAFTPEDVQQVLEKVGRASLLINKNSALGSSLAAFDAKSLSIAEFREICRRTLNIAFTDGELAAAVDLFSLEDSNKQQVSCVKFMMKFQGAAFEQKEKTRSDHLKKKFKSLEELEKKKDKLRQMLERGNSTAAVDFNYSTADSDTGMEKIRLIAKKFNKSHPSSPSLEAFDVATMSPSLFRSTILKLFHVTLTPKEVGAVLSDKGGYLNAVGDVDITTWLAMFTELNREFREASRKKQLKVKNDAEALRLEAAKKREMQEQQQKTDALRHQQEDERSLLDKLKKSSALFAVDSSSYIRSLQSFKGPALTAAAFKDTFFRIFLIKISLPEVGLLMNLLNPELAKNHFIEGEMFLKAFFKLARLQEQVLLGLYKGNDVTIDVLKPALVQVQMQTGGSPSSLASVLRFANREMTEGDWSVGEGDDFDAYAPEGGERGERKKQSMMSVVLAGENPWVDWGLREKGYLGHLANTRGSNSVSQGGKHKGPKESTFGSPPTDTLATLTLPTGTSSSNNTATDLDDTDTETLNTDFFTRVSNMTPLTGAGNTLNISSRTLQSISSRSARRNDILDFDLLENSSMSQKLLRSTLPRTFSPVGLARRRH